MNKKLNWFAAVAGLMLATITTSDVSALETFRFSESHTIEVGKTPEITIETVSGDIEYTGTDATAALVQFSIMITAHDTTEAARIRDELKIVVNGEDGYLELRAKHPKKFHRWLKQEFGHNRRVSVSFAVDGPRGASGEVSTISGDIDITHIEGNMDVQSVSGDITISDARGRMLVQSTSGSLDVSDMGRAIDLNTVSGDVHAKRCGSDLSISSVSGSLSAFSVTGAVDAETISGDITLIDVGGALSASTTSGNIEAEHRSGNLVLSSTSGDIFARSEAVDNDINARSISGTIELEIGKQTGGKVRLSTFSGNISSVDEIRVSKLSRRKVIGTLGDGNGSINVQTFTGDIVLSSL